MSIGLFVPLIGVSVMLPLPPLPLSPTHVKVDPATLDVGVIFNVVPEQKLYVPADTEFPTGVGKTPTNTEVGGPSTPLARGVTTYSTTPPFTLNSCCAIIDPLPGP